MIVQITDLKIDWIWHLLLKIEVGVIGPTLLYFSIQNHIFRIFIPLTLIINTRNTCMQQPLALIGIQGTIFSEHEVFRVYDFEIVFIFTLSIFFKKCENNESIVSFNSA